MAYDSCDQDVELDPEDGKKKMGEHIKELGSIDWNAEKYT